MVDKTNKLKLDIEKFKIEMASKYNAKLSIITLSTDLEENAKPTLNEIKKCCVQVMHDIYPESINIKDLKSNTRAKFYPMIRQVYGYLGWKYNYSYAATGSLIKKDHSTIVYSKKKVEDMLFIKDKKYTRIFNAVNNLINEKYVGTVSKNVK